MKRRNFVAAFSAAALDRADLQVPRASAPADTAGVYDVSAYGAKGDGRTDDRPAIQAAISAAQSAAGGIVYFPPGTYLCSFARDFDTGGLGLGVQPYALALNRSGRVTFKGAGRGVSVLKKTTAPGNRVADYNLIVAAVTDACPNVAFEDLTLDGGQTASQSPFTSGATHLILAIHMDRLVVNRCDFQNARGGGIYVWQAGFARIEQSHFTRLDIDDLNNAITLIGSDAAAEPRYGGHVVRDCAFVDNGQIGIGIGGYQGSGPLSDVLVSGCTFRADTRIVPAAQAVELNSVAAMPLKRVTVEDCQIFGGCGFSVQGTEISVRRCVFTNMDRAQPAGSGIAIRMPSAPTTARVTLEDVVVDGARDVGIWLGGAADGEGQMRLINVAVYNAGREGIRESDHDHGNWNNAQVLQGAQFIACRTVDCGSDGISINSGDVHLVDCISTGNGRAAPGTYSGLAIGASAEAVQVIGGRYGAIAEPSQKFGIDDRGRLTQITGAQASGRAGAVNRAPPQ